MNTKNKLKVGDIVECWGFADSPPKWREHTYRIVKRAYRAVVYWCERQYQKIRYGFAHEDAWSFYSHSAAWSLPRLKFLRSNLNGYPWSFMDELSESEFSGQTSFEFTKDVGADVSSGSQQKWEKVLDKIIWSMENHDKEPDAIYPPNYINKQIITKIDEMGVVYAPVDNRPFDYSLVDEHEKRVQEGFDLFGKHFRNIWG